MFLNAISRRPGPYSYVEARGGNCLLVTGDTTCDTITKRTKDVVTRCVIESPNAFRGRALPGPAGGA